MLKKIKRKIKKIITYMKSYILYFIYKIKDKKAWQDEIITIIDGGLGSQMSQFAIGQEIQRITGIPVSYDLSWYKTSGKDINGIENRKYEIEAVFSSINIKKAPEQKIKIYKTLFNKNKKQINDLDIIDLTKPPIYLGGYWKTEKYNKYNLDLLRNYFTFNLSLDENNQNMLQDINTSKISVAVQIRMGDYIGSIFDVVTPEYFSKGIEYINQSINQSINYYIFSTEPEKAKNMLPTNLNYTFVNINDNGKGAYDMYLMSRCHHFIISNSTFGYWGALLSNRSPNKIVIQPDKWLNTDTEKLKPMYPGWIVMEC